MNFWFTQLLYHEGCCTPISLMEGTDNEEAPCWPPGPLGYPPHDAFFYPRNRKGNVEDAISPARTGSELTNTPVELCFSVHELSPRHSGEYVPSVPTLVSRTICIPRCHTPKYSSVPSPPLQTTLKGESYDQLFVWFQQTKTFRSSIQKKVMVLDSMFEYQQGKERVPIGFSMVLEESYQPFCMKRESRLFKN